MSDAPPTGAYFNAVPDSKETLAPISKVDAKAQTHDRGNYADPALPRISDDRNVRDAQGYGHNEAAALANELPFFLLV